MGVLVGFRNRQVSVVSLDPIRKKNGNQDGLIAKFFKTRHFGGKKIRVEPKYGLYAFCGPQGSGKTMSAIWYSEKLAKQHKNQKVHLYSNIGLGVPISSQNVFQTILNLPVDNDDVNIVLIDEAHVYFQKDTKNPAIAMLTSNMLQVMGQLAKRHCYILAVAQIFGRMSKEFREQCLYLVECEHTITHRVRNAFIRAEDIICDDLGRWGGSAEKYYIHGLPSASYNRRQLITFQDSSSSSRPSSASHNCR